MGSHITNEGQFQSDKYPTCPAGKVPLSVKDPLAQDLLWEYAQRRRPVDAEFSEDLETALKAKGFSPPPCEPSAFVLRQALDAANALIAEAADEARKLQDKIDELSDIILEFEGPEG